MMPGIEEILQEQHLRYKSLPGVRASVPYIVKRILERLEGKVNNG